MSELSGQEFFELHGYYPTVAAPPRRPKLTSPSDGGTTAAQVAMAAGRQLALRGWRAPLHWTAPPPFEYPGRILEEVGLEAFKELVKEYWTNIREYRVEQARKAHSKWAIRQILRTFETHVRGFRKQAVSRRGGIFPTGSDELVLPEYLTKRDSFGTANSRILAYLESYLRAYGVPQAEWPAVERLVRTKLTLRWGVPA